MDLVTKIRELFGSGKAEKDARRTEASAERDRRDEAFRKAVKG